MDDKHTKVLVVDGDRDECSIIHDLLVSVRGERYEVECENTYDGALAVIRQQRHDAYLVDYRLGTRSGLELIREAAGAGCARPMLLMTGQGGRDVDMQAMDAGATDFLDKNQFDPSTLERTIRYAIERKKTLDDLQEREEKINDMFRSIVETMEDGIVVENETGLVVFANDALVRMLGCDSVEDVRNQPWMKYLSLEDEKRINDSKGSFESALLTRDGRKISALISSSRFYFRGESLGVLSVVKDITERKRAEEALEMYRTNLEELVKVRTMKLEKTTERLKEEITERKEMQERIKHLALHDNLTGMPNRYLFFDRLQNALHRAARYRHYVAVLYIDLDGFKDINDRYGHDAGDEALREAGRRIKDCLRRPDTAARIGGDEFAAVITDLKEVKSAEAVAQRIIESLTQPIRFGEHESVVSASIGISFYPNHGRKPYLLLRNADSAMYEVKKRGKNDYAVFSTMAS